MVKPRKPIEKVIGLRRIEIPFIKGHYVYFFRVGEEIIFVDPTLVVGSIFTERYELVFPCTGKLVSLGYNEYAVIPVAPSYTDYRLHLLSDYEDVPVSKKPYSTQTFRLGDRTFAYFVPLPEDEYAEDEWDDDYDYDDYDYDDDED